MAMSDEIPILDSMADFRELILDCMDAGGVRSVVETGADTGAFTTVWGEWADTHHGTVYTVEPSPSALFLELVLRFPSVHVVAGRSPGCLSEIEPCDAYVIDGDHNYHTVSGELSAIVSRADASRLPLIVLHDVGWPWGRRDSYYSPELLPDDGVHPHTFAGGVRPGVAGLVDDGVLQAGA
jgi:Methyltransferase domain